MSCAHSSFQAVCTTSCNLDSALSLCRSHLLPSLVHPRPADRLDTCKTCASGGHRGQQRITLNTVPSESSKGRRHGTIPNTRAPTEQGGRIQEEHPLQRQRVQDHQAAALGHNTVSRSWGRCTWAKSGAWCSCAATVVMPRGCVAPIASSAALWCTADRGSHSQ